MKKLFFIAVILLSIQLLHAQEPSKRTHVIFEAGDLVSSNTARISDGDLAKANEPYSPLVIGVYNEASGNSTIPRILCDGIAYIKFDPSNGAVSAGDFITSSAKAGYGMKATKAGFVVGVVLDGADKNSGLIKIRVQPMWVKQ
ncbi:hypothetical protein BH09BAC1_BH09BAC1_18070 [soil metagenome]